MLYGICFVVSLCVLLWFVAVDERIKLNQILLIVVTVIGDGGHYALSTASSLETAILANKLTYVIGIFSPMLLLFNVCEVCKVKIKHSVVVLLYAVQIALYLCVCTTGTLDIFYKTIEFHTGEGGSYITKTYGPLHSVYLIILFAYVIAGVTIAAYSFRKKNKVSTRDVDILMLTTLLIVGAYMMERLIHLRVELMPFVFTIGMIFILLSTTKLSFYSIEDNKEIIMSQMEEKGYIVFSKNLRYMGCNEYAETYFPELKEWEMEKEIPGNGGRFNTFLRQSFMKYVKSEQKEPMNGKSFVIKDRQFHFILRRLNRKKRHLGYIIELIDLTDFAVDR